MALSQLQLFQFTWRLYLSIAVLAPPHTEEALLRKGDSWEKKAKIRFRFNREPFTITSQRSHIVTFPTVPKAAPPHAAPTPNSAEPPHLSGLKSSGPSPGPPLTARQRSFSRTCYKLKSLPVLLPCYGQGSPLSLRVRAV